MNVLPAGQLVSIGTCKKSGIRKNKEIEGGFNEKDIPKSFVKYFLYSTLSSIKLTSEAHFKVATQQFPSHDIWKLLGSSKGFWTFSHLKVFVQSLGGNFRVQIKRPICNRILMSDVAETLQIRIVETY